MKNARRLLSLLLLVAMLLPMLPSMAVSAFAETVKKEDAMEKIEASDALAPYKVGETQRYEDDGYIGIPYEITLYYDAETHGEATPGYVTLGATPVMLYVVNANVERIGTESDESIILSMLARGFAVAVLDYLGDVRAVTPDLDFSAQLIRSKLSAGEYFTDGTVLPKGTYADHLIVPAGYNVLYNDVFFELDKHGVDGTLERIVHAWNHDFRIYKKNVFVKWVRPNGERKPTQTGFDGSSPVWYADAAGKTVDQENGQYTKVQWTMAEAVTDCVKPDGSPIDLNLYIHVLYPTSPAERVPVMTMFSSSGYLVNGSSVVARPQMQGFLFDGYAGVLFDYAWIPMGRNDHFGYFDGSSGSSSITGDNQSYATFTYNASQVATAAMRYTRYLALSEPETYAFDTDAVGVFGISKAAWMTHLGAPVLRENLYTPADGSADEVEELVNDKINSFYQQLMLPEHHGETRYDNGLTETYTVDGATVDGGERQPYATWNGYEISSGAQMVYSSCGASVDYFCEGYSPQFITENLQDTYSTEYGKQNEMVNLCRTHNIPALWYEANIAHTFAEGLDYRYGVDIYMAFRKFADYYLKDSALSVTYTDPMDGAVLHATDTITVKLIGDTTAEEISKATLTDSDGDTVSGSWTSAYGDTEWTFTPNALTGGETYTLTLPAEMKGKNGVEMGEAYTATFHVRAEGEAIPLSGAETVGTAGKTVALTVPSFENASSFVLRVRVTNDAANLLSAYDAETGALLGAVRVSGIGSYEIDVTDALAAYGEGETVRVRLCTEKESGKVNTYSEDFNTGRGDFTTSSYAEYTNAQTVDGETALKIVKKTNYGKFKGDYWFYERGTVLTNKKLINGGANVSRADMGRRFIIKLRLYDTASRRIMLSLNSATSKAAELLDFDRVIYTEGTVANAWSEYEIPYTVYEADYGLTHQKQFYLTINSTGDTEMPIYVDQLDVYEVFTDVELSSVVLASKRESDKPVKAPSSENAFSVDGTEYATFKEAIAAAKNGSTVTMLRNYVLTNAENANLGGKTTITVDLGGYRLTSANTEKGVLWISATDSHAMTVTLKNGSVLLGAKSLLFWGGATAAGSGKAVDVRLENLYLTHGDDYPLLTFLSENWIENNAAVSASVTLTDCTLDIDRCEIPNRDVVIFTAGKGTLDISYTLVGGRLIVNDLHDVTLTESITDVRANGAGESFKILVPASEGTPVISYRKENAFAMPALTGEENGYCIYTPADAKNSSDYGAIPDKYLDKELYPFVIFSEDLCVGGASSLQSAALTAKSLMEAKNGATVAVLMTRDFNTNGTKGAFIAELNGTLILDLGGHVLSRNDTVIEGMVGSDYAGSYGTSLVICNGTVLSCNNTASGHLIALEAKGQTEKRYDVLIKDVTFALGTTSAAEYLVTRCWGSSGTQDVNLSMTLEDCTFDFAGETEGSKVPEKSLKVFDFANTSVKADVHVVGGQILSSAASPVNVTWASLGADDSLVCDRDENGNYITISVPSGTKPTLGLPTEEGVFSFSTLVSDGERTDVYTLTNDTVKTEYGSIPAANAGNVFALFMNGNFVGARDTWKEIQKLARTTLDQNKGGTVTVLMRANHTHASGIVTSDRIPFINGTVVVDLGGHALTTSQTLFECGTASYTGDFDTTYTVKNGYLLLGEGVFFAAESRSNSDKHINLTFENVTVEVAPTFAAKRNTLFVTYGDQAAYTGKVTVDLTLDGVTLDLRGHTATSYTFFGFGASAANVAGNVTVKGGEILVDKDVTSMALANLADTKDSLRFVADAQGRKVTLTAEAAAEGAVLTERGFIPAEYADAESYPFVILAKDGKFNAAKAKWSDATGTAYSYLNSNKGARVTVLVRRDYTGSDSTTYLGRMQGTLVIDLGGHTMGRMGNSWLEAGTNKMTETEAGYAANVIIKNGRLLAGRADVTGKANSWLITSQTYVNYDKTIHMTFDGVTFGVVAGQGSLNGVVFGSWGPNNSATGILTLSVLFRDCDFDFTGSEGTTVPASTTLVKLDQGGDYLDVDVTFEGCEVLGTAKGITLTKVTANDTVTYKKNADGKYFRFDTTNSTKPTADALNTEDGTMYFTRESFATVSGTRHYYFELGVKDATCDGVVVPYMYYLNKAKYPYIIAQNGAFIGAREDWRGATGLAIAYVDNAGDEDALTTLYLVRDITENTSGTYLSGMRGKVIVDLGGFTLTANQTLLEAEGRHAYPATVEVKDGTIVINRTGTGSIIALNLNATKGDGSLVDGVTQTLSLTFTDVTFRYAEGATTKNPIAVTWAGSGAGRAEGLLTFHGCTFDMRAATGAFNLINANNASQIDVITVINGGEILLPASHLVTWYNGADEGDSLTLGKRADAYPTLTLTSGKVPADAFRTAEGDGYFYSVGNGACALGIGRAVFTGASLNLGSDLSMLYYVRIHDSALDPASLSVRFTVNGKSVTVTAYETVNGEYVFTLKGIAPQQMADNIEAVLLADGEEIFVKTDYSVKQNLMNLYAKSAEALGMSEEKHAAMKTLIADLLTYGAAAQDYTDYRVDLPVLDGTEGLLPSTVSPTEEDAMHLTGNTDPALYFKSASVRFDTVNSVNVRISVTVEGLTPISVTVDGKEYALSDLVALGNGEYLITISSIFATDFDTVHTVTLSRGDETGATLSYSVNSYAYAMRESTNAKMKTLALALYRYGVSAEAYARLA